METSNFRNVSTKQQRIAELARQSPAMGFTSLAYFMDIDWMREAYQRTRKDGAAGVDGQTAADYEANLEQNLQSLLDRAKSGTYRVLLRLIGKWLPAGVLEEGTRVVSEFGVPQGGVISPLLSNVYLHYVLDAWFEREVKPRLRGRAFLIRYADDLVIGCAEEADARQVMDVLPKRFGTYGLTLHPEKTRLVLFRKPGHGSTKKTSAAGTWPGTFNLLGFTHYWGRSRKGYWVVKRKTATSRLQRMLTKIYVWCRWHRHNPIDEQHRKLSQKLNGHYGYFGITGSISLLQRFRHGVVRIWHRWLSRRGSGTIRWDIFGRWLERYPLPKARVVHSVFLS